MSRQFLSVSSAQPQTAVVVGVHTDVVLKTQMSGQTVGTGSGNALLVDMEAKMMRAERARIRIMVLGVLC